MNKYMLTEDQLSVQELAKKFADEVVAATVTDLDRKHEFPLEEVKQCGEMGFLGICVPEEYGGGSWSDGNNQVNQWIVGSAATNPNTGESYDPSLWASSIEMNLTATTNEWMEKYNADNEVKYLEGTDQLKMVANINIPLATDSTDIALIRSQCGTLIKDTSWQMVFAADEAEFNSLWDNMMTQLEGLSWSTLTEYDTEKYQPLIDARIAAAE